MHMFVPEKFFLFIILVIILSSSWVLGFPPPFCAIILLKLLCHPSLLRFSHFVVSSWFHLHPVAQRPHHPGIILPFSGASLIILVIILGLRRLRGKKSGKDKIEKSSQAIILVTGMIILMLIPRLVLGWY